MKNKGNIAIIIDVIRIPNSRAHYARANLNNKL